MPGLDSNTKLLLHLDGADEAQATTDASDSGHTINFNATAQLDTAAKKWGTASLLLDGNSDYLDIDDSADWDVCGSNADNWTLDCWVKHTSPSGEETYLCHYEDGTNHWAFKLTGGDYIQFFLYSGGSVDIVVSGGSIADSNWHHVAMCKVGNDYGVYLDGSQVGHAMDNDSTDTFAGSLHIGSTSTTTNYMDGHLDEIRVQNSNYFGAAPQSDDSDTITVPPSSYARDLAVNVHDCADLNEKVGG